MEAVVQALIRHPRPIRLHCRVQHYEWGDVDALPQLLHHPNPDHQPFAELWAGAHPDLPALACLSGRAIPLDQLIAAAPKTFLGPEILKDFGEELPFLLKLLAIAKPLSLQVHPDADQARQGFLREEQMGIPRQAPQRSYRDPHPKPELFVALTEFFGFCGFRAAEAIAATFAQHPELKPLDKYFREQDHDLAALYRRILALEKDELAGLLHPLLERLAAEQERRFLSPTDPAYWVLEAHGYYGLEPGLLVLFLLHLVHLKPGEGLFIPAGELHAYLRGLGVEVMGNSNNVLRAGLTRKFVNPQELLRIVRFQHRPPQRIQPVVHPNRPEVQVYPTPARAFLLHRCTLAAGQRRNEQGGALRLLLLTQGRLRVDQELLAPGEALFVPPGISWTLEAEASSIYWQVQVPTDQRTDFPRP